MQISRCIILCGGKGTRLKEFNPHQQKCLTQINNLPFIEYLLEQFSQYNITLCTGHLSEQIEEYYGQRENINISREEMPLGTGGAIINSLSKINDEIILISNGDSFCRFDLNDATEFFFENKIDFLVITTDNFEEGKDYGLVEINEQSMIKSFNEKPSCSSSNGIMNSGIYIARSEIFKDYSISNISLEKEIIPVIVKNYRCYAYNTHSKVYDIGTPKRIEIAENFFKDYDGH